MKVNIDPDGDFDPLISTLRVVEVCCVASMGSMLGGNGGAIVIAPPSTADDTSRGVTILSDLDPPRITSRGVTIAADFDPLMITSRGRTVPVTGVVVVVGTNPPFAACCVDAFCPA